MPDLSFHVRDINNPNIDLDPSDFFQIAETEDGDYIVPNDSSEIFALQWGRIEGEEGLHLFVYIDKKALSQIVRYDEIDQHW